VTARLEGLVGVYNADHTLRGELTYVVGARLGRAHCALCDITHGTVKERSDWKECRNALPIPFDTFHRNDQPAEVRDALKGAAPAVAAVTDQGVVPLLDGAALDRCDGDAVVLITAIESAVAAAGLAWPSTPKLT
jgi:hypothetical protein